MIKKADIFLGLFLILLCLGSLFFVNRADSGGDRVTVSVNGQQYGVYDLNKNQRIDIKQKDSDSWNIVEIKDGAVFMAEASCSNQVCVHQGAVRRSNQTIVCLPNRVVVSISGSNSGMDAVSY